MTLGESLSSLDFSLVLVPGPPRATDFLINKPGLTPQPGPPAALAGVWGRRFPQPRRVGAFLADPAGPLPPPSSPQLLLPSLPVTHDFPSSRKNKQRLGLGPSRGRTTWLWKAGVVGCVPVSVCVCVSCPCIYVLMWWERLSLPGS